MKTKELIRQLNEADPTGENECVVNNVDIFFVSHEPAYYDGRAEMLIRDETNKYYNVVGAKVRCNGTKIQIHLHSIEDAILSHPDLPVDLSELHDRSLKEWEENISSLRAESIKIKEDVERWFNDEMEKYYAEFIAANNDKQILEKHFGGWLDNNNRRSDVRKFLEKKAQENFVARKFLEEKMDSWVGPAWWEKKTENC